MRSKVTVDDTKSKRDLTFSELKVGSFFKWYEQGPLCQKTYDSTWTIVNSPGNTIETGSVDILEIVILYDAHFTRRVIV